VNQFTSCLLLVPSSYHLVHLQQVPMKTTAKSDYNLEEDDLKLPWRTRGGGAAHPPASADVPANARVPAARDAQEGLDVGSKRRGVTGEESNAGVQSRVAHAYEVGLPMSTRRTMEEACDGRAVSCTPGFSCRRCLHAANQPPPWVARQELVAAAAPESQRTRPTHPDPAAAATRAPESRRHGGQRAGRRK
jgi:hypothetical protein